MSYEEPEAYEHLTPELIGLSHKLTELGIADRAWSIGDLLVVLDYLGGRPVAILGGDVYEKSGGRIVPTYENWHCDRGIQEEFKVFAARSLACARDWASEHLKGRPSGVLVGLVLSLEDQ